MREIKKQFETFSEYWSYTKYKTEVQREKILSKIPKEQQEKLMKSYKEGGWEDLMIRNNIDEIIDSIKGDIGVDLLAIRCGIFKGKEAYLKKAQWEYICDLLREYNEKHTGYILGGITASVVNGDTVILRKGSEKFVKGA